MGKFRKEWDEDQTPLASTAGRILPKLRSDPREVSMIIGVCWTPQTECFTKESTNKYNNLPCEREFIKNWVPGPSGSLMLKINVLSAHHYFLKLKFKHIPGNRFRGDI